jgi:hypothetical protein
MQRHTQFVYLIPVLLFVQLFSACKTIKPDEPHYETSKKQFTRSVSYVNIPLEIPLQVIENKINAQFKGVIYDDDSYTRPTVDDVKIRVYQNNRIGVTAIGNELKFTIPLKIWAQGRYEPCAICPEIEKQTVFDVEVYLRSKVEILKDYKFRINTVSDGFEWKSQPKISIGPINVPIARLLENVIDKQLQSITKEIDSNVNGLIDLRQNIESLWSIAQDPILLDDSSQTWLKAEPKALLLAPITSNQSALSIILGLETYLETFTGNKPSLLEKKPLPDLRTATRTVQDFTIQIRSELSFDVATEIAKKQLLGQEFHFKKKVVRIEDIQIYGKGDLAYVKLIMSGSLKGELFLSGIPTFNSQTNELSIEQLDYDLQSKNVLVKAGSWLLNGTLQKQLQQYMRYSFDNEISSIRNDLSSRIKKTKHKNLFTLKGNLKEFKVRDVYMAQDHFDIVLDVQGNAKIMFDSADF